MATDITIIKNRDGGESEAKSLEVCLQEESVQNHAKNARELFSSLQSELDDMEDDLKDGLSYLDMKNDTLLSYMIDMCNILLRKLRCENISGHESVERTVYYRVILEKIKSIDQRLAYQLNKVISMPDGVEEEDQGVNVKNLDLEIDSGEDSKEQSDDEQDEDDEESDEFDGSVDDEGDEQEEEEDEMGALEGPPKKSSSKNYSDKEIKPVGIYKPPKLRSVAYNDGKSAKDPKIRRGQDDFDLGDLGGDDFDDDQDIVDNTRDLRDVDRRKFEEDNYTRLPGVNPRKAKRKLKAKSAVNKGKKKFKGNKRKGK